MQPSDCRGQTGRPLGLRLLSFHCRGCPGRSGLQLRAGHFESKQWCRALPDTAFLSTACTCSGKSRLRPPAKGPNPCSNQTAASTKAEAVGARANSQAVERRLRVICGPLWALFTVRSKLDNPEMAALVYTKAITFALHLRRLITCAHGPMWTQRASASLCKPRSPQLRRGGRALVGTASVLEQPTLQAYAHPQRWTQRFLCLVSVSLLARDVVSCASLFWYWGSYVLHTELQAKQTQSWLLNGVCLLSLTVSSTDTHYA